MPVEIAGQLLAPLSPSDLNTLVDNNLIYNKAAPLHMAAVINSGKIVQLLIEKGADPKLRDSDKVLPLCYFIQDAGATLSPDDEVIKLLLAPLTPEDIDTPDQYGMSLRNAVRMYADQLSSLLPNKVDNHG
jgi:ankyrin repeat protein